MSNMSNQDACVAEKQACTGDNAGNVVAAYTAYIYDSLPLFPAAAHTVSFAQRVSSGERNAGRVVSGCIAKRKEVAGKTSTRWLVVLKVLSIADPAYG